MGHDQWGYGWTMVNGIKAHDPSDLFNQVFFNRQVKPIAGRRHGKDGFVGSSRIGLGLELKAQALEDRLDLLAAVGSAQNLLATGLTHGHRLGLGQTHHLVQDRTGLATADLHHQVGQHRQLISRGGRVYPALKPVTSVC